MPSVTARRSVKPRFDVYKEVSLQIRAICTEHTPAIEPLSLDEAYLDVTDNLQGIASATEIAERIRAKIRSDTSPTALLSRSIPGPRAEEVDHLIIELKAPKVKIGSGETTQIQSYAFAVIDDERFRDSNTRWTFGWSQMIWTILLVDRFALQTGPRACCGNPTAVATEGSNNARVLIGYGLNDRRSRLHY